MCKLCTPLLAMAAAGILAGQGMALPSGFSAAAANFAANPLAAGAQILLGGASAALAPIASAVSSIPGFITGAANSLVTGVVSGGPFLSQVAGAANPLTNFVSTLQSAGQSFFTDATRGVASIFNAAQGYAQGAFEMLGSLTQAGQLANGELAQGFSYYGPGDYATGGYLNELSEWTSTGFAAASTSMQSNMGSYFSSDNLLETFTPGGVVKSLVAQGFGDQVLSQFKQAGISYEMVQQGLVDSARITQVMDTLPNKEFAKILTATGLTAVAGGVIQKFSDTLNPQNILPPAARAGISSLENLGTRIFNVTGFNGNFSSMADVGKMLGAIEVPPELNNLKRSWNSRAEWVAQYQDINRYVGNGNGPYKNPTMQDLMGVATGQGYTENISLINRKHAEIINTTQGQQLLAAFQAAQGVDAGDSSAVTAAASRIQLAAQPFINPANATLAATVASGTSAMISMASQLKNEDNNLRLAEIVPGTTRGDVNNVVAFASGLHAVHDNSQFLGQQELITNLITNDKYGEAILASIIEGKNLKVLQSYGINIDNRFDPTAYAASLADTSGI